MTAFDRRGQARSVLVDADHQGITEAVELPALDYPRVRRIAVAAGATSDAIMRLNEQPITGFCIAATLQ